MFTIELIEESILRIAAKNDAQVTRQEEWLLLSMRGEGEPVWHTFLHCAEEERLLVGYLLYPGTAPPKAYQRAAQSVARLNEHLKFGAFVFGEEQGEIRLRISQFIPPALGAEDTDDFIYRILNIAVQVADACLPKLLPILTGQEGIDVSD